MAIDARPGAPQSRVLAAGARWSRWIAAVAVLLAVVATALPGPASQALVVALVGAGLLAGLPHGSIDHRVGAALTGRPAPLVAAAYAGVAALTWVLLTVAGPIALAAVLTLSIAHFGLGELEILSATTGWRPSRSVAVAVAVAGTGALLLPLARSGNQLAQVAAATSPQLGALLGQPVVRAVLAAVWVLAACIAVASALRAHHPIVALDVLMVGALGALAPPLVAFAVWFGGWHALRHCARLLTVDARCAGLLAQGRTRQAIGALVRLAAWPTLAATATLAALLAATAAATDPAAAIGETLIVLLALTVPHMLVVLWLDHQPAVRSGAGVGWAISPRV